MTAEGSQPPSEAPAGDVFEVRLQVGRVLRGPLLAVAVALRVIVVSLLTASWAGDWLAPAWVVVSRKGTREVVGRISAGREPGAGERLLDEVQASMSDKTVGEFLHRWDLLQQPT